MLCIPIVFEMRTRHHFMRRFRKKHTRKDDVCNYQLTKSNDLETFLLFRKRIRLVE